MIILLYGLQWLVGLLIILITFYFCYFCKWITGCCGCFTLCILMVLFLCNDWKVESLCVSVSVISFESQILELVSLLSFCHSLSRMSSFYRIICLIQAFWRLGEVMALLKLFKFFFSFTFSLVKIIWSSSDLESTDLSYPLI